MKFKKILEFIKLPFKVVRYYIKKKGRRWEDWAMFAKVTDESKVFDPTNTGLLIDWKSKRLSLKESFCHLWIFGKPWRSKTQTLVVPNILDASKKDCSMVITDLSGELFEKTSKTLKNEGFEIWRFNPENPNESIKFNPYEWLTAFDIEEIEKISMTLITSRFWVGKDPVWNEWAGNILKVIWKCLSWNPKYFNLPNQTHILNQFWFDWKPIHDWIVANSKNKYFPGDESVLWQRNSIIHSNQKMLESFKTIAEVALSGFNNPKIKALFSSSDIKLWDLRKKKIAFFISIPEQKLDYYRFILDILYERIFATMMKEIPKENDKELFCFMEEFWSQYIPNFSTVINNIRKYRVSITIVMQNVTQLFDNYGQEEGQNILSSIWSLITFSASDHITSEYFSRMIGKKRTMMKNNFWSNTWTVADFPLLAPEQIRTMKDDELLFVSQNKHPSIIQFTPWFKSSKMKELVKPWGVNLPKRKVEFNVPCVDLEIDLEREVEAENRRKKEIGKEF